MIALLRGVGMAMLPALVAGSVTIEARAVTSVSVDAPIFDERSTAPYGCPPAGCVGENTRVSRPTNTCVYTMTIQRYVWLQFALFAALASICFITPAGWILSA